MQRNEFVNAINKRKKSIRIRYNVEKMNGNEINENQGKSLSFLLPVHATHYLW